MGNALTIGRLAKLSQVNVETIRYYQRRGLVPLPEKVTGAYRKYPPATIELIQFIKKIQAQGFSLDEISTLLNDHELTPCMPVHALIVNKTRKIQEKIENLMGLQKKLQDMLDQCPMTDEQRELGRDTCPHETQCSLINNFTLTTTELC